MDRISKTICLVIAAGAGFSCAAEQTEITEADKVARGEYLVAISGCNDCHTPGFLYGAPDFDRRLSGSDMGWAGPSGVVYPSNLTPDEETGLGGWTDDEIVTALRSGMRPDGRILAPSMPWAGLSHLTDDDAYAIAAYLRTLPAVLHKEPEPVPPDQQAAGPVLVFPPPSEWDVPPESAAPPNE
jgi:mono/diheme cytochrome c family protein